MTFLAGVLSFVWIFLASRVLFAHHRKLERELDRLSRIVGGEHYEQ